MKHKVKYLPQANRDLITIADTLTDFPKKAVRLFREMERKLKALEKSPYSCQVYPANPEYRRMVLEGHILFYKVDDEKREVKIYRVIYAKRDISNLLED
jgi:plasmid stabilization system protein ParE